MRSTNLWEKVIPSVINVAIVVLLALPFLIFWGNGMGWKLATVTICLVYNLIVLTFNQNRCIGMMVMKTHWAARYSVASQLAYAVLYTASFATLFFSVYFPFDLFLFNILLLQLPTYLIKGTTFHGYLSGNMETVRKLKKGLE